MPRWLWSHYLAIAATISLPAVNHAAPTFLTKWGSVGAGPSQFSTPLGIAIGPGDEVFVSDTNNHRIQVFSPDGTYLRSWGSQGSGPGQFGFPKGIACSASGEVFVVDVGFTGSANSARVQVFSTSGAFLRQWGFFGAADGGFEFAFGIAVDPAGNVYVCDQGNSRIDKFTSDGAFLLRWGGDATDGIPGQPGRLNSPFGIVVGPQGDVFVVDSDRRTQQFHPDSTFVRQWDQVAVSLAVDKDGNIYGSDPGLDARIQVFTSSGVLLTEWGGQGSGDGQFDQPDGVAVDSEANVYVLDTSNNRVQKFGNAVVPTLKTSWGQLKARFK